MKIKVVFILIVALAFIGAFSRQDLMNEYRWFGLGVVSMLGAYFLFRNKEE